MRRLLLKSMIGILLSGGAVNAAVIAKYTFDNTLADSSGNGYNLAVQAGSAVYGTGKSGASYNFDGTNFLKATSFLGASSNAGSVALWYKDATQGSTETFVQSTVGSGGRLTFAKSANNNRIFSSDDVGNSNYAEGLTIFDGEWHHLVLTFNGVDTAKLYIDGSYQSWNNADNPETHRLGTDLFVGTDGGAAIPDGEMDDLIIYNEELSANAVTSLYAGYTSSSSSTEDEVVMATQAQTGGESSAPQAVLDSQISTSYSGTNNNNFTLRWSGPWNTDVYFEIYYRGALLGITEAGARSYTVDLSTLSRATNGFTICAVNDVGSSCNASPIFTPWGLVIFLASLFGVRLWRRK